MRGKRMVKRVIVFGVHSYIGFGLCERMLSEGVEIKGILSSPKNPIQKRLLEERLLMVGRNALIITNEVYENTDEDKETDMIVHCCEDSNEPSLINHDRKNMMISVKLAHKLKIPFVFVSARSEKEELRDHVKFCENYLYENVSNRIVIKLPSLYGPYQPSTEKIHQYLLNRENGKENVLSIDEPLLYIQDAVDSLWDIMKFAEKGKTYAVLSKMKRDDESNFLCKQHLNESNSAEEGNVTYIIKEPTSIEEGLKAQAECINKYRKILNM